MGESDTDIAFFLVRGHAEATLAELGEHFQGNDESIISGIQIEFSLYNIIHVNKSLGGSRCR
jgi:hypothetical protein